MPYLIAGAVERLMIHDEPHEPHAWRPVLHLDAVFDNSDPHIMRLFGLGKRSDIEGAVFGGRGLPASLSDELRSPVTELSRRDPVYGMGLISPTHMSWQDLKPELPTESSRDQPWTTFVRIMEALEEDHRIEAPELRIVIWGDWG